MRYGVGVAVSGFLLYLAAQPVWAVASTEPVAESPKVTEHPAAPAGTPAAGASSGTALPDPAIAPPSEDPGYISRSVNYLLTQHRNISSEVSLMARQIDAYLAGGD